MMTQLGLREGQLAHLRNVSLSLGRFLKIQPQELAFLDLSNPKAVYVLAYAPRASTGTEDKWGGGVGQTGARPYAVCVCDCG
jgi:hypothetical protein